MTSRRKGIVLVAGIAVSVLLLWLSFSKVDFGDVVADIARVNLAILSLNLVLKFVNFNIAAIRTHILIRPLHHFPYQRLFKSLLLAFAVNNVVPFRAGEVARIGYLAKHGDIPPSSCLAIIAVERVTDLFVLGILFLTVIPLAAVDLNIGASLYVALGAAIFCIGTAAIVSKNPENFVAIARALSGLLGSTIQRFIEARATTFANGLQALGSLSSVVLLVGMTMIFWTVSCLGLVVTFWAFGIDLPWFASVVVLAFLTVGLAVPSTPGNIGTFHYAATYAMITLGVGASTAGSFSVVSHAVSVIPYTLLAIPVFFGDYLEWSRSKKSNLAS